MVRSREIYINYRKFAKSHGEIMPDGQYIALSIDDAIQAIDLLNGSGVILSGGDIVVKDDNGSWSYVMHVWGSEYYALNWYYDEPKFSLPSEQDIADSYKLAKQKIEEARKVAKQLGKQCWVVLVV
jgi:hypothetical protein